MSVDFIRFGFISGELAPNLYGHTDLEKYDFGLALSKNWFIDYHGGAQTRPGLQFGGYMQKTKKDSRFHRFDFSPDGANHYIVLFEHQQIRFIFNNAYVLEDGKAITAINKSSQMQVTATGHGFSNGDWIYLSDVAGMTDVNGMTVVVSDAATNTFKAKDTFGNYIDSQAFATYVSGGTASRVYTVDSPYDESDLRKLRSTQLRDTLRLTHRKYPIYNLTRNDHADWTLELEDLEPLVDRPTGVSVVASDFPDSPPGASTEFQVTAVDWEGNESMPSEPAHVTDFKNPYNGPVTLTVTWDAQPNVHYFNVYRAIIRQHDSSTVGWSAEYGYVGRSYGGTFKDNNIIPDFTKTPPIHHNPFANRTFKKISVVTGGSGYSINDTVSITTSTGSGFLGFPVVQGGEVVAIVILDGGQDYSNSDTVVVSGGTGATFTFELGTLSGNYPGVSAVFQQRMIYAGSNEEPETIFGSKPGKFSNFDEGSVLTDDDSYEHEIDSERVSPIRHLIAIRGGLLVMSDDGIWVLNGEQGVAVTPTNAVADPQSFNGVAQVPPVKVDEDLVYVESRGYAARLLAYKDLSKVYSGQDISFLSSHFFTPRDKIQFMAYASAPQKTAWCVRDRGSMLSFTIMREQNLYAWAQHWTRGKILDVISVRENDTDIIYVAVERYLNGETVKTFERMMVREFDALEDAFCVDCGLELPWNKPAANITISAKTGYVIIEADAAVFASTDETKVVRAGGGRMTITRFIDTLHVEALVSTDVTSLVPYDAGEAPLPVEQGDWTMDPTVTQVTGLWHLANTDVVYLADGAVGRGTVDASGALSGLNDVSRCVVGLSYDCDLKTLPVTSQDQQIEGRKRRTVGAAVNMMQARGLKIGTSFDKLYPFKERTTERYGDPVAVQDGTKYVPVSSNWTRESAVCIRQSEPLPAIVRAIVLDVEVGDDKD